MDASVAKIGIGTIVLIRSLEIGAEQKIKLVKSEALKPQQNGCKQQQHIAAGEEENGYIVISDASPLGRALLGRERGEIVTIEAPAGVFSWEIIEILA